MSIKKYTAIYTTHYISGSHMQHNVQMKRMNQGKKETVEDMLKRENIHEEITFLFEGWPKLEGEARNDSAN